jgi:hypothetical protein
MLSPEPSIAWTQDQRAHHWRLLDSGTNERQLISRKPIVNKLTNTHPDCPPEFPKTTHLAEGPWPATYSIAWTKDPSIIHASIVCDQI